MRELERFLMRQGFSPSRLDIALRRLREASHLAVEGRGPNARQIEIRDAAMVLIAYAGSGKASNAAMRLTKLLKIKNAEGVSLGVKLQRLIEDPSTVDIVAISRTHSRAWCYLKDGTVEPFEPDAPKPIDGRFKSAGVIDATLLNSVRQVVHNEMPVDSKEIEPEDSE